MSSLGGFRGAALGKKGAVDAFLGNGHVLAPARKVKSLTVRGVAALLVWRRLLWRGRRGGHGRIVRRRSRWPGLRARMVTCKGGVAACCPKDAVACVMRRLICERSAQADLEGHLLTSRSEDVARNLPHRKSSKYVS